MEELNTDYPIFFSCNDESKKLKLIKKIIKDQYNVTCRCHFDREYVLKSLTKFDYGFILLSRRQAKYGENRGRKDLYNLKSFILFNYSKYTRIINGLIICSIKTKCEIGNGRRLMDCVFKYGYENGALLWELRSLPYEKLYKFYEEMGFIYVDTLYERGEIKSYRMDYIFNDDNKSKFYKWLSKYRLTSDDRNISIKFTNSPLTINYETKNDRIIQGMILFIDMFNETNKYNKGDNQDFMSYVLNSELINYCTEEQIGFISKYESKNKTKIMLKGNLEPDEYDKYYDLYMTDRSSTIFIMVNTNKLPLYEDYIEGINIVAKHFRYKLNTL